jgi:hypothetical protein
MGRKGILPPQDMLQYSSKIWPILLLQIAQFYYLQAARRSKKEFSHPHHLEKYLLQVIRHHQDLCDPAVGLDRLPPVDYPKHGVRDGCCCRRDLYWKDSILREMRQVIRLWLSLPLKKMKSFEV